MEPKGTGLLDFTLLGSMAAVVGLVAVAMAHEVRRLPLREQRIVSALGIVDRCESCHDASKHTGTWTSTHAVERFACTSCHGGQGLATMADHAHKAQMDWERPLFNPAEREANCGTCHKDDRLPEAPLLDAGRRALRDRGCAGCHDIGGRASSTGAFLASELVGVAESPGIGPALDGLRDKVSPAWVRSWLTDPAKTNPAARMPRFELTKEQIEALSAFLFSLPGPHVASAPSDLKGDSERGKIAVATRRCATCHLVEGRGGAVGPGLDVAGAKIKGDWLFAYLTDTHAVRSTTRMPGFRIPGPEAADIVAYAAEQWVPDTDELPWSKLEGDVRPELAEEGRRLFTDMGCRGCHFVSGVPHVLRGMPLANIANRHLSDLPAPDKGERLGDIPSWVARKITEPHAFDASLGSNARMPAYRLDEAEARAIGVAVASLRTTKIPADYVVRSPGAASKLPGGATGKLVERFRCLVCHRLGGEGGDVSRVPLEGEGSRVKREWLEAFLQSPVTIRMDQAERMPVLGIDPASAARLASWIEASLTDSRIADEEPMGTDVERGRTLFDAQGCPTCHVAAGRGQMKGPTLDGAQTRLQPAYIVAMLAQGNLVVPERRHPAATIPIEDARALTAYVCSLPAPTLRGAQVDTKDMPPKSHGQRLAKDAGTSRSRK